MTEKKTQIDMRIVVRPRELIARNRTAIVRGEKGKGAQKSLFIGFQGRHESLSVERMNLRRVQSAKSPGAGELIVRFRRFIEQWFITNFGRCRWNVARRRQGISHIRTIIW